MRPGGLVALGAALVALLLPSIGSGVLSTASPAPAYMSGLGERFELLSNDHLTNAKEFTRFASSNSLNKPPGKFEQFASVWTRTCDPRKDQTVSFRRTIDIPGPPSEALFQVSPEFGNFSNPLKHYKLEINGGTAREGSLGKISGSTIRAPLGAKKLKLFHHGLNTIEVTVKRNELPEHVSRCNKSKKNRVAVFFVLSGKFAVELGLVEQAPQPQYYKASTSRTATVNLTVTNNGPSGLVPGGGVFTVDIAGATKVALASPGGVPNPQVTALGPPFGNCQVTSTRIVCELGPMSSGDRGVLSVYVQRQFQNTNFDEATTSVGWHTGSGSISDPRPDNNDRRVDIVWCGDKAESEGCKSAG